MPYIGKSPHFGVRNRFIYTATGDETSKSGADDNGATLTFTDGAYVDVYLNGVLLKPDTDYVTTTANTIGSLSALSTSDILEVIVYDVFSVSDTVSATSGGTFSGAVVAGSTLDMNGTELILDADADTSITADTDDQIDFRIGGSDQHKFGSEVVFNEQSEDINFRVESNGLANMFKIDAGDDVVLVGAGVNLGGMPVGATQRLQVASSGSSGGIVCADYTANSSYASLNFVKSRNATPGSNTVVVDDDGIGGIFWIPDDGTDLASYGAYITAVVDGSPGANDTPTRMVFATCADGSNAASERMRILADGNIVGGRTSNDLTAAGWSLEAAGTGAFVRASGPCLILNRKTDDGEVIRINQDATTEGTISVSGSTVTYGGFTGSHWSRLSDNSKPTILIGTVMESIDEMCDWYQAEYTFQEEVKYADGDSIPFNKKVGDVKKEKIISKDSIALPEGKKVGDTITHTVDGVDYTAKILQEEDIKHAKCKVSDSADSKCVYGVFLAWDTDDDVVNDMKLASLGTYVVRIHKDQTVSKGDLLTSNGDGTAKKQDDDIIRSKTIGKVLSNVKQETYSDGSYTVPCALYCG